MIHSHSCSTFIGAHRDPTAEAGSTARLGFQDSSADSMKEVPSIVLLANTSMAQYRAEARTVTSL
jgi:hypothetical protein